MHTLAHPSALAAPPPQAAPQQPLAQWLRLLWDAAPPLHLDSETPFIADGGIHLPARPQWQQHCAAAAHAAAHLVYSPRRFVAEGLVPTARALLALLEDARVEALAMRELPGLARLWRPLHTATPDNGPGCEALFARLARALADPAYEDPHPWVAKGRRLFYLDEAMGLPALRTPAELRTAAMRLGHDIGQARLPFNARGYQPAPAYRDDHRWMWAADQLATVQPPSEARPRPADAPGGPDPAEPAPRGTATLHPEWDQLIRRLRPDWVRVVEEAEPPAPGHQPLAGDGAVQPLDRQLLAPLKQLLRPQTPRGRAAEGEVFHFDALLGWSIARRCAQDGDLRVYRARQPVSARARVWLLIDSSASAAAMLSTGRAGRPRLPGMDEPGGADARSLMQTAARCAAAAALALQALGVACTVAAFRSHGRHAVQLRLMHGPGSAGGHGPTQGLLQRLTALQPAGSTRLGAALRHAALRLGPRNGGARWVLLVSDGQAHDVDVHEPGYLIDDARHAVITARRHGVRMACLALASGAAPEAERIFGRGSTQAVSDPADLPRALRRLVL